ncbi:DUF2125 domain-containing protein [Novispirillum sp. DQ9]|uniref:DUF2125 domain-containing protein n=1 Tax=Novispirillum sp. DQ9 TaxID=3398612 RepID=UPI003C7C9ED3
MDRFRWALIAVPVLIIALGGGYGALWLYGARQVEESARAWLASQRAAGWEAEVDSLAVGGFPGRIELHGSGLRLAPPPGKAAVPWHWRAEGLRAHALAWSLREPTVTPLGTQVLTLPGADGEPVAHTVTAGTARLDLKLDGAGQIVGFALDAASVAAKPQGAREALTIDSVAASLLPEKGSGQLLDLRESSYTASLTVRGLTVPPGLEPPLGPRGEVLEAHARILGPVTLNPAQPLLEAVKTWRDDGGSVELDRFYLEWAPLRMSMAGSLALDQRLQPVASLSARFQGFFAAVNRLEDVGVVRAREASVARVVLGVMAERDPAGGAPLLAVPVTVQDRTVRVGPVTVLTFPLIEWGGEAPPAGQEIRPGFEVDRWGNVIRRE